MGKKYHCDICEGIHESARELFEIGLISEARMREYDKDCLAEEPATDKAPEFFGTRSAPLEMEHVTAQYSTG